MKRILLSRIAKTLPGHTLTILLIVGVLTLVSGTVMAHQLTKRDTSRTSPEVSTTTEADEPKPSEEKAESTTPEAPAATEPEAATPSPTPASQATRLPAQSVPSAPAQSPLKVFKVNFYSVSTHCDHNTWSPAMTSTAASVLLMGSAGGIVTWVVEALVSGQVETGPSGSTVITPGQSSFSILESQTRFTRTGIHTGDAMRIRTTSPNAVDSGWIYASVPICSFE